MRLILCAFLLGVAIANDEKDYRSQFAADMARFKELDGLQAESLAMTKQRFQNYVKVAKTADDINADDSIPYTATTNFLSILTVEEVNQHLGFNASGHSAAVPEPMLSSGLSAAPKRDFRSKACVGIKNQGGCGSCWTFGAASSLESEIYFVSGKLASLSEQEYLECASGGNDGCNGGWMEWCYTYNVKNNRMGLNTDIPYKGRDDSNCAKLTKGKKDALKLAGVKVTANVNAAGENNLLNAASSHVISVGIHVNNKFQVYSKGVYVDASCNQGANHAVTVVGYGTEGGRKFWIVRNSWGASWGDKGYIKMDRNKQNMCQISTYSHYPKVECAGNGCKAVSPDDADSEGSDGGDEDGGDDDGDDSGDDDE